LNFQYKIIIDLPNIYLFLNKAKLTTAMKKFLFTQLLSLFTLISFSQHSQITISDDFKIAETEYKNETITHSIYHNNYFYTATNSGIGGNYKWLFTKFYDLKYAVTISKFDKNMHKIGDFELAKGEKQFGPLAPELILLNNKLCLAYFQSSNKTSFDLYLSLIDENNLTLKEPKKICTIQQENVGIFKIESIINAGLVFFTHSADNTKTLIACNASPNTILSFVADSNLNIVKQTVVHTSNDGFSISRAVLTNDNVECYILSSVEETKAVWVSADGKKSEAKLNPSGNLVPYSTNVTLSKDGKSIYIYSTTSLGKEDKNCNGLLLSQLDCGSLQLARPLSYEFMPEMVQIVYGKGGGTEHKKEYFMNNFMPHLMELDNGSMVILGSPENESVSSKTAASFDMNNRMQTQEEMTTTLDVGPVMAFYLNKNGKTFDYAIIPRKLTLSKSASSGSGAIQIVESPDISHSYSNFTATNLGDAIAIVYDDDETNLTRGEDEKISEAHTAKNLVLAEALINKDKKLEYRKQIGKNMSGRYTYFLGNTIPTSSSSIIFPIAKDGNAFSGRKIFYTNWCFLDVK
jgi:hypothetical protein